MSAQPDTTAAGFTDARAGQAPAGASPPREAANGSDCVCVIGMHRSGTSLVSSLLRVADVNMGSRLLPAQADNPRGYFEDVDFVEFHEKCLWRRSRMYSDPGEPFLVFDEAEAEQARGLIAERRRQADGGTWGWKDPRTCLFLRSWSALLPEARCLIVHRHPLVVLDSLLRRKERLALADPARGLDLWCTYTRAVLDFAESHPAALSVETEAALVERDAFCSLVAGLGIRLERDKFDALVAPSEFTTLAGLSAMERLLAVVHPESLELHNRMRARCRLRLPEAGAGPGAVDAAVDRWIERLAPLAGQQGLAHSCLLAGALLDVLSAADAKLVRVLASVEVGQELLAEREVAREHYLRALSAEKASAENYARVLSAESASAANYERALAAERAYDQLVRQRGGDLDRLRTSQAGTDSLRMELDATRYELEIAAREGQYLRSEIAAVRGWATRVERRAQVIEAERNWYRRRWPPYALKRLYQKAVRRWRAGQVAGHDFGTGARVVALATGLPTVGHSEPLADVLSRLSSPIETLVLPGECPALRPGGPVRKIVVSNWWAPDVARLVIDAEYVWAFHPQYYGGGPLWNPVLLEMFVAALASEPAAGAIACYADEAGPRIGVPNYVHPVDAATIASWDDAHVAVLVRGDLFTRAFPLANHGESRDLARTLGVIHESGYGVLMAPQHFPSTPQRIAELVQPARDDGRGQEAGERADAGGPKTDAQVAPAIRALYVTQWLECGGADKGAVDLLSRIDPRRVDFSLLTTVASRHPWEHRVRNHVREVVHLGATLPLPPDQRFPAFLVEYVRRRNIGLVHIMHSILGYDALPELKKALPGVRVVDQCHILEPPDNMEGGHAAYSSRRYKQYLDHRTVTSRWLARYLTDTHGIPESRISVIYTGVDFEGEFNPQRHAPGAFRGRLGLGPDTRLVVFAGRLHWQKRPELFVRIAENVQRRRPDLDAVFVLVGPGELREELELRIAALPDRRRVLLAGEVPHSAEVFRDADLLLMPSGHEGLAYVSYEAMAMGVPQIFTDVNGQSELITPETGVLIPVEPQRTVEEGTRAVLELLDDEPRRQAMAAAGRRRIAEHFGIKRMVEAYETLYRQLV